MQKQKTNEQIAFDVSSNCIVLNMLLAAFKLFAGLIGNSAAMVSDAVHSASDVISTVIVMIGVKMANKKPDSEHTYGHERFECVAAIIVAVILALTGGGIGLAGVRKIMERGETELMIPGAVALIAAVVSLVVKEAMYWYTRAAAKKIDSGALMADAWHHRSDALSSVGAFIGIAGARLGYPVLDAAASVVICLLILKAAVSIFLDAIGKMTDKACGDDITGEIRRIILEQEKVDGIDKLQTRLFGDRIYVDVEISINGAETLHDAHIAAERVHDAIEQRIPKVKHCMVHMNPTRRGRG